MATQVVVMTADMVREHQLLMWIQHPSGDVTVRCHGVAPDDTPEAIVTKTCDVGVWLLRNCGGCTLPVRAIFDEQGYFCSWFPEQKYVSM